MKNIFTCCICGKKEIGYGNDPYPLMDKGKCCTTCNLQKVIPARIILFRRNND